MLQCKIVCVGKIKERYFEQAVNEYRKRLSRFCKLDVIEVADEKAPDNLSDAQIAGVLAREGERVLAKLSGEYVVALCIDGEEFASEVWAEHLSGLMLNGISRIAFVIGGSHGLSGEVIARADARLSFSKFTFCHQMMRVILLEQIYRAMKILAHESYHK